MKMNHKLEKTKQRQIKVTIQTDKNWKKIYIDKHKTSPNHPHIGKNNKTEKYIPQ